MESTSLALTAVLFIAGELAAGGLKEAGKDVYGKIKGLFKPEELTTLGLLEKYPESKELQCEVAATLDAHLEANPAVAKELEELLKQIPATQIKQNTIDIKGDGNIAVQDVSGSEVNIK